MCILTMSSILFVTILISFRAHHHGSCGGWWLDGGQHLLYTGMAGDILCPHSCGQSLCLCNFPFLSFLSPLLFELWCLHVFPAMPLLLFYIYFKYIEYNPILFLIISWWHEACFIVDFTGIFYKYSIPRGPSYLNCFLNLDAWWTTWLG